MNAFTLVFKNLSRRKGRAIISSTGLVLSVAIIVSTFAVSSTMQAQVGDEMDKYGPDIIVTPNTQSIDVAYGSVIIGNNFINETAVNAIYTIPNCANIRVVSPKLYDQVSYENNTILVIGSFPDKEAKLKKWWSITGSLPNDSASEILIGSALAASLNLTLGSNIPINNASFKITGILSETGSTDDYSIFMPLPIAQALFNQEGKVSEIDVSALCNYCPVDAMATQIMNVVADVKAVPVKQTVETRMQAVETTSNYLLLLALIVLVVGIAGIMNTMLASVHERTKELGVFMSLGVDSTYLYKVFLLESVIIGLIGGILGTLVGIISSVILGPLIVNNSISLAELPIYVIPLAIGLSVLTSMAASLYPIWIASKTDPVKALRTV